MNNIGIIKIELVSSNNDDGKLMIVWDWDGN